MFKLKIKWELETGESFEEWTIPYEIAELEKEFFNGKPAIQSLIELGEASYVILFFLAYKIQKRISTKPIPAFNVWATTVTGIERTDWDHPKASKQDQ